MSSLTLANLKYTMLTEVVFTQEFTKERPRTSTPTAIMLESWGNYFLKPAQYFLEGKKIEPVMFGKDDGEVAARMEPSYKPEEKNWKTTIGMILAFIPGTILGMAAKLIANKISPPEHAAEARAPLNFKGYEPGMVITRRCNEEVNEAGIPIGFYLQPTSSTLYEKDKAENAAQRVAFKARQAAAKA